MMLEEVVVALCSARLLGARVDRHGENTNTARDYCGPPVRQQEAGRAWPWPLSQVAMRARERRERQLF